MKLSTEERSRVYLRLSNSDPHSHTILTLLVDRTVRLRKPIGQKSSAEKSVLTASSRNSSRL